MATKPVQEVNPLKLSADIYDILNMLRTMDRHLEARDYAEKIQNRGSAAAMGSKSKSSAVPGSALRSDQMNAGKTQAKLSSERLKGRKIIRRIMGDKRFKLEAKAILTKNERYIKGQVINISKSGMFLNADRQIFQNNEKVRLYIRPVGMQKSYHAVATVIRFNSDPKYPRGYGLKFVTPE